MKETKTYCDICHAEIKDKYRQAFRLQRLDPDHGFETMDLCKIHYEKLRELIADRKPPKEKDPKP